MSAPRRRADDWKLTSNVALDRRAFGHVATLLGYDPRAVVSIRLNDREAVVTHQGPRGIETVRHPVLDPTERN